MKVNVTKELAALEAMTMVELRNRYDQEFGEETWMGNKAWLIRRIIWRLQAQAEGGLSERARHRAAELVQDTNLRLLPPRPKKAPPSKNGKASEPAGPKGTLGNHYGAFHRDSDAS